jgi:hypothetical protein
VQRSGMTVQALHTCFYMCLVAVCDQLIWGGLYLGTTEKNTTNYPGENQYDNLLKPAVSNFCL